MANILFWQGAISKHAHLETYQTEIEQLIYEPTNAGLHLEKLRNSNIYSIRANDTIRLLLTTYKINGKAYVLILKALTEHEYEREKEFIENGESEFIKKYQEKLTLGALNDPNNDFVLQERETEDEDLFSILETIKLDLLKKKPLRFIPTQYLDNKFLIFNEAQDKCHETHLPFILNGIAGSGKSLVCLSLLMQALTNPPLADALNKIAYIAPHQRLLDEMKTAYCRTLTEHQIAFVEYEDYIEANGREVYFLTFETLEVQTFKENQKRRLNQEAIMEIIQQRIENDIKGKKNTNNKAKKHSKLLPLKKVEDIFKELMLIAGLPGNPHEQMAIYLTLGCRQTFYHTQQDKAWIVELFHSIQQSLLSKEELFPCFSNEPVPQQFDCMFIDEAQLLYLSQLKLLDELCLGKMMLCSDTNQNWDSVISVTELYKHCHQMSRGNLSHIDLNFSYRNSLQVTKVANTILRLKSHLIGANNQHEDQQIEPASTIKGRLIWADDHYLDYSKEEHLVFIDDPDFAVIIFRSEDFDVANQIYPNYRIFYPEDVQGLEYQHILLFNPFNTNLLRQFEQAFGKTLCDPTKQKIRVNRGKQEELTEDNLQISTFLKLLFIAATRPKQTLLIRQTTLNKLKNKLIKDLFFGEETMTTALTKASVSTELSPVETKISTTTSVLSPTKPSWRSEALKLIRTGNQKNIDKGKTILSEKLNLSEREINKFIHEHRGLIKSTTKSTVNDETKGSLAKQTSTSSEVSHKANNINAHRFFNAANIASDDFTELALKIYTSLVEIKRMKTSHAIIEENWLQPKQQKILELVKYLKDGWQTIKAQPEWINEDEDLTLILIEKVKSFIYRLNIERWHDNKIVTLAAVKNFGVLLKDASPRLKQDYEICMAAVLSYPKIITEISQKTHRYMEIVCTALFDEPNLLEKLGFISSGTADYDDPYYLACIHAIRDNPKALEYCLYEYRHMIGIAAIAIINEPSTISFLDPKHPIYVSLFYISKIKNIIHRSMRQLKLYNQAMASDLNKDCEQFNAKLHEKLTDRQFVLDTLAYFPTNYSLLAKEFKASKQILARAMICRPETIYESPNNLKNNTEMLDIANDENIFSRYIKLLKIDASILEYASKTFLHEPHKFCQLAEIAIEQDKSSIIYVFNYLTYFAESIATNGATFLREKINDFKDVDALLSLFDNSYYYDEFFTEHRQILNDLMIDTLILLDKDSLCSLIVSTKDLRLLLNQAHKSLHQLSFFDFMSFIGNVIQSDFLVDDLFKIILNVFAPNEKLVTFFPSADELCQFIYDLVDINQIFEIELYQNLFFSLSPLYLASLCKTKNDFEKLIKCLSLTMQFNSTQQCQTTNFQDTGILYDFISAFENETIQSFYPDAIIDYGHFIELLQEFQFAPSLLKSPGIDFALRNCYQLIENAFGSHLKCSK